MLLEYYIANLNGGSNLETNGGGGQEGRGGVGMRPGYLQQQFGASVAVAALSMQQPRNSTQ